MEAGLDLQAIHGEDVLTSELVFMTGKDAKYYIQDYSYNQNKSIKLQKGKNSGNSKTFVCASEGCPWMVIATKSKRKNDTEYFYFSTIKDEHSPLCTSTRKASERQQSLLTHPSNQQIQIQPSSSTSTTWIVPKVSKRPRRDNIIDMVCSYLLNLLLLNIVSVFINIHMFTHQIVQTLCDMNVRYHKLSVKRIQVLFQEKHGTAISAHTATRAKEAYRMLMATTSSNSSHCRSHQYLCKHSEPVPSLLPRHPVRPASIIMMHTRQQYGSGLFLFLVSCIAFKKQDRERSESMNRFTHNIKNRADLTLSL
jgi:hypothetical protein